MRMQKTDMEFVTFDAKDVIMTSITGGGGGGNLAYFTMGSHLLPDVPTSNYNGNGNWFMGGYNFYNITDGTASQGSLTDGKSYQLTSKSFSSGYTGSLNISHAGEGNSGTKLETARQIFDWLNEYGEQFNKNGTYPFGQ